MAHNFLHSSPAQAGMSLPSDPKALVDRFLDAIWMERGLSENTLGAYRADLLALNQRLATNNVELARATRRDPLAFRRATLRRCSTRLSKYHCREQSRQRSWRPSRADRLRL